ncbi:MAG: hypothetical protein AB1762_14235 [Gemmatimonadota bacterium]
MIVRQSAVRGHSMVPQSTRPVSHQHLGAAAPWVAMCAAVLLNACGTADSAGPPQTPLLPGAVRVRVEVFGNGFDPDGFTVTVGGRSVKIGTAANTVVDSLREESRSVRLSGLAPHCFSDVTEHTVDLQRRDTAEVQFSVECYGDLAFIRHFGTDSLQLFYLAPNGEEIQLSDLPGRNFLEDWSPDGWKILFTQSYAGVTHIYSVRIDGTDLRRLTHPPGYGNTPRWSPDGSRVAFYRRTASDRAQLYLMNADGTGERPVLDTLGNEADISWSPDGRELAFGCNRFRPTGDVCTVFPDGTNLRPRIRVPEVQKVQWSPDGARIAFVSHAGGQHVGVATLADSTLVNLTPGNSSHGFLWSSDGKQLIVSATKPNGDYYVVRMNRDGSAPFELPLSIASGWLAWSRDDAKVLTDVTVADGGRRALILSADGLVKRVIGGSGWPLTYRYMWNPRARPGMAQPARGPR